MPGQFMACMPVAHMRMQAQGMLGALLQHVSCCQSKACSETEARLLLARACRCRRCWVRCCSRCPAAQAGRASLRRACALSTQPSGRLRPAPGSRCACMFSWAETVQMEGGQLSPLIGQSVVVRTDLWSIRTFARRECSASVGGERLQAVSVCR